MTVFEIAALLGAAAWLPQIVLIGIWIYKAKVTPRIQLVPGSACMISYGFTGSSFGFNCAITVSKRDAIVQSIGLILRHEKGQSTKFRWSQLTETFSEIRNNATGETAQVSKKQAAIALKVSTLTMVEKYINFVETEGGQKLNLSFNKFWNLFTTLQKADPDHHQDRTIKSQEYVELMDFYKNDISWQCGRYTVEVYVYKYGCKDPDTAYFGFTLSNDDIERINKNRVVIDYTLKKRVHPALIEKEPEPKYEFLTPSIYGIAKPKY